MIIRKWLPWLVLLLAACGQKGALTLSQPPASPEPVEQQSPATEPLNVPDPTSQALPENRPPISKDTLPL